MMKIKTLTVFAIYYFCAKSVQALTAFVNHNKIDFRISELRKCFKTEKAYLVYNSVSLGQCVADCGQRSGCGALNYRRMLTQCELFASINYNFIKNSQESCVHVRKTYITVKIITTVCNCKDGKVCDTGNNNCIDPVCPKLDLVNGKLFGDMTVVGARIEYTCDEGCIEIGGQTHSTCEEDGTWTHNAECIRVCPKLNLANGELFGDMTVVGALIEYTCDEGYIEIGGQTGSTCQEDGTWTHNAECIRDCLEPATYTNSTLTPGLTTENTTRNYSCDDFYMMSINSTNTQTTCNSSGQWSAADFTCILDYKYLGCYENYGENRILTHSFMDGNNMTPELCVRHCFSTGNIFAAPEAIEHCFCGNQLAHENKVDESECNLGCSGDNTLTCGAGFRASVFKKAEGSKYLGCYKDLNPSRILTGHSVNSDPQMTTQICLEFCREHGYKLAGTEFAKQCFCGDVVQRVDKRVDNKCNMPCNGNEEQFCGGAGHASLYMTD